jgi:hypothetical protein
MSDGSRKHLDATGGSGKPQRHLAFAGGCAAASGDDVNAPRSQAAVAFSEPLPR